MGLFDEYRDKTATQIIEERNESRFIDPYKEAQLIALWNELGKVSKPLTEQEIRQIKLAEREWDAYNRERRKIELFTDFFSANGGW